jgi:hypothetical protein
MWGPLAVGDGARDPLALSPISSFALMTWGHQMDESKMTERGVHPKKSEGSRPGRDPSLSLDVALRAMAAIQPYAALLVRSRRAS